MRRLLIALALSTGACNWLVGFDAPAEQGAQCSDGVDNDGNGLQDCEEASCVDQCGSACGAGVPSDDRVEDPDSGHCYLAFNQPLETFIANDACRQIGGYLAVPDDAAEDALIRSVAPDATALGLVDFQVDSSYDFRQVTGDRPAPYLNFSAGQPDEIADQPLCVSYDGAASTWQDNPCSAQRPYVCELTTTPCGDQVLQPPESCDDGNQIAGDGCGLACVDEDECALGTDNCGADADCINQPWQPGAPGFGCQCAGGFVGDGFLCTAVPPAPAFAPLAGAPISDALLGCTTSSSRSRKIVVDPAGVLYAAMLCPGGDAEVVVSVDAGVTWSPPVQVGAGGVAEVTLVAVSTGRVVVGMASNTGTVLARQSIDFGATWGPARTVFDGAIPGFGVSLASDGFAVFAGFGVEIGSSLRVHRSIDPELASWPGGDAVAASSGDVLVDPETNRLWAVGGTPGFHLVESVDGGQSFPGPELTPAGSQDGSDWAIGGGFIFATGRSDEVLVQPFLVPGSGQIVGGLPSAAFDERAIAADPVGNAYVAQAGVSGGLTVARVPSGASVVDPAVFVDDVGASPSLSVVPGGLVAVVYTNGQAVYVAIVDPVFPP